jgi:hypothetical protein
MGDIVRHAAQLQNQVDKIRGELRDREVSASSGDGCVTVSVTCAGQVRGIRVDPGLLQTEGLELVLDMIVATTNRALAEADAFVDAEITKATGGLRIPGVNA